MGADPSRSQVLAASILSAGLVFSSLVFAYVSGIMRVSPGVVVEEGALSFPDIPKSISVSMDSKQAKSQGSIYSHPMISLGDGRALCIARFSVGTMDAVPVYYVIDSQGKATLVSSPEGGIGPPK